jgi:hypothetical protein
MVTSEPLHHHGNRSSVDCGSASSIVPETIEEHVTARPPTMKSFVHVRNWAAGWIFGRNDFRRFRQHHHDASAVVLQLLARIMVGTDIVHAVVLTG